MQKLKSSKKWVGYGVGIQWFVIHDFMILSNEKYLLSFVRRSLLCSSIISVNSLQLIFPMTFRQSFCKSFAHINNHFIACYLGIRTLTIQFQRCHFSANRHVKAVRISIKSNKWKLYIRLYKTSVWQILKCAFHSLSTIDSTIYA